MPPCGERVLHAKEGAAEAEAFASASLRNRELDLARNKWLPTVECSKLDAVVRTVTPGTEADLLRVGDVDLLGPAD